MTPLEAAVEYGIPPSKEELKKLRQSKKKVAKKLGDGAVEVGGASNGVAPDTSDVGEGGEEKKKKKQKSKKRKRAEDDGGGDGGDEAVVDAPQQEATATAGKKKKKKKQKKSNPEEEQEKLEEEQVQQQDDGTGEEASALETKKTKKKKKDKKQKRDEDTARTPGNTGEEKKKEKKKNTKKNGAGDSKKASAAAAGKVEALPVSVEGMHVSPLTSFDGTGMAPEVMRYVTECGFTAPTIIQAHCWPVLCTGRDIVGIAETGSGKTLGFSLPGLSRVLRESSSSNPGGKKKKGPAGGPFMLVLAPTRELALQSAEVIAEAGKLCGLRSACVYGGVPKHEQRAALRGGAHVVVATPGRLKDLVGEGVCDLSRVGFLVLDEADRMLDLGFEQDVRDIVGCTASVRQTAMFSATWPKTIRDLAAEFLKTPVKVTVGADDLTANSRVEQRVEVVEERERDRKLITLLEKYHSSRSNRVLVFALYKREAARLEGFLKRSGWKAVAVHGDKGQAERESALGRFRECECPLMVATDVAARGLDIPDVEHVINYSFPLTIEDYIHRIGRTGRAGKNGVSHTFFHQGDKARAGELVNVLQEAGQAVPEALTKFGTHIKKKEHKLYGAFSKDVDMNRKAVKTTFADSDDE